MPRFSLRTLLTWVTIVCLLLALAGGFLRAISEAQREARRQAIRSGRMPPEKVGGVLITPDAPK
jgi:hypothetical protein